MGRRESERIKNLKSRLWSPLSPPRALLVSPKVTKNVPFDVDQWKKGEREGGREEKKGDYG